MVFPTSIRYISKGHKNEIDDQKLLYILYENNVPQKIFFTEYFRTTTSEFMQSIDFNNGTENLQVSCGILRSVYFTSLDKKRHQIKIITFISSLLSSRFKLDLLKS